MNTLKFRASSVWKLMTEPKLKSEKISETTKTYLRELYLENNYDRRKDFTLKYTEKRNICEPESISMLSRIDKLEYFKNTEHYSNEYIHGTPDITVFKLIDVKTSWDIFTFMEAELKKEYYWQLQSYMWLTGYKESELVYTLVDTPDYLIANEQKRQWNQLMYKEGIRGINEVEFNDEITKNLIYTDIEESKRIKRFLVPYEQINEQKIINKIELAKEYYKTISL